MKIKTPYIKKNSGKKNDEDLQMDLFSIDEPEEKKEKIQLDNHEEIPLW